jgi:hypothetical protein
MIKFVCLSGEGNPLVHEVEAQICRLIERPHKSKGKYLKPGKFPPRRSVVGNGRCKVLQYTGTDGKDEKNTLRRNVDIVKKTVANNGHIC